MPLSDKTLMEWATAASIHGDPSWTRERWPAVEGLRPRDVELAGDVSSLLPMLYLVPRYLNGYAGPLTLVEIGTSDGSTMLPMLRAAAERGGHLHSVDPSACEDAHLLVAQFGYGAFWTHHRVVSDEFFAAFHEPIDFAFIDGDHAWPQVARDLVNCWERLRSGGIVWASDYGPLRAGFAPFAHEADKPSKVNNEVVDRPHYDSQCVQGIEKGLHQALPKLAGAQILHLPVWPNPSVLIRRCSPGEVL